MLNTVARFRIGVKFLPRYKYMSRRGDSRRRDILWWYHVNKYRAMRANWSELAPGRKSTPVSCRHPLTEERVQMVGLRNLLSVEKRRIPQWHVFMALSSLQTEIFLAKWQFFFQRSHLSLKALVAIMIPIFPQNSCECLRKTSLWICLPPSSDGLV